MTWAAARASLASWFGLAKHADAFRLSRDVLSARDVRDIGKRLLVQSLQARRRRTSSSGAGGAVLRAAVRTVDGE